MTNKKPNVSTMPHMGENFVVSRNGEGLEKGELYKTDGNVRQIICKLSELKGELFRGGGALPIIN